MKLTANHLFLSIITATFLLTSCQKQIDATDPITAPGNTNTIIGDYDFVGASANTYSTVTVSSPGGELKSVTTSGYFSKDNAGTVKITASDLTFMNIAYSVDTTANAKTYLDGALFDDSDFPFEVTLPPTTTTNTYVKINSDSLSVTGSIGIPNPTGAAPAGPVGIKYSWSGDTLILKENNNISQNISQGGIAGVLTGTVNAVIKLKKH